MSVIIKGGISNQLADVDSNNNLNCSMDVQPALERKF